VEIASILKRFDIRPETRPPRHDDGRPLAMPRPGVATPPSASSKGLVDPRRDAKVGVFTPRDDSSSVALEVSEAIFFNPV
jgi:hypothetical protein